MNPRVLLVRDGLDGAAPWMTQVLREAGMNVRTISGTELADAAPSDVLLLHLPDRDAVAACWALHRQGHRSVIAVSGAASSKECIRLLNAGADYYWTPGCRPPNWWRGCGWCCGSPPGSTSGRRSPVRLSSAGRGVGWG